jgi:isoquinoline 1-oxidoreductase subunit beta
MKTLTRREFLNYSLSGAGLLIGISLLDSRVRVLAAPDEAHEGFSPNAWLKISPDDQVTVLVSKSEMGQGVITSLPMIVAEELEADWNKVRAEFAPAADVYRDPAMAGLQAVGGSSSVRHLHDGLRTAGAAAREMLMSAAAKDWGVPESECEAKAGAVVHAKSGRSLTYGRLCVKAAALPIPAKPALKDASKFQFIGKAWPRNDMADKCSGKAKFGIDSFVDGMLYGAIARPPSYGAKPTSYDKAAALAVRGVRKIVELDSGVGILADNLWSAWKGRKALKVQWGTGSSPDWSDSSVDKLLSEALERNGVIARDTGDAAGALRSAAKTVEAVYSVPYLYHATMEPMNCTADVRSDGCDVWAATQNQTGVQQAAAQIAGLNPEKVNVHTTLQSGRKACEADLEPGGRREERLLPAGQPLPHPSRTRQARPAGRLVAQDGSPFHFRASLPLASGERSRSRRRRGR